jgi:peptide-methionine (S)-S-oxide reductase
MIRRRFVASLAAMLVALASCGGEREASARSVTPDAPGAATAGSDAPEVPTSDSLATAVFASGCFWCSEADFEKVPGVLDAVSGYSGGRVANPTYEQVSEGGTGHREVVQVRYDPRRVTYARLLDAFWVNVDPFDAEGQFCDKGFHYTAAIYTSVPDERRQAEASRAAVVRRLGRPVATAIVDAAPFYPAEGYHQGYAKENPLRYNYYRSRCGRDARLRAVWGRDAGK